MKNPFNKIYLHPNFRSGHMITWELDPTFTEPAPWSFTLEVSEVPTFSAVFHTQMESDVCWMVDKSNKKQNWDYAWYYRVVLTTADGQKFISPSIMLGGNKALKHQYLTAAEIIRKELLLMSRYTGKKVWLLKRKIYAERVKALVDPVSGVALADTTKEYGTGLKEGYHTPIPLMVQSLAMHNSKKLNVEGNGVDEFQIKHIRTVGFPLISPRDVIVFPDTDTRYVVQGEPEYTHFPGTEILTIQTHACGLLPNTDTVYNIPIPLTR